MFFPSFLLICLIRMYQMTVSPWLPRCCRFTPTCSDYALEALRTRGLFSGLALSAWRILRCNPFCKGGFDPVPGAGRAAEYGNQH